MVHMFDMDNVYYASKPSKQFVMVVKRVSIHQLLNICRILARIMLWRIEKYIECKIRAFSDISSVVAMQRLHFLCDCEPCLNPPINWEPRLSPEKYAIVPLNDRG